MSAGKLDETLAAEVAAATDAVRHAETAVDGLLTKLSRAPRAEKVTISAPLEAAMERLREARALLDQLDT